MNWKRISLNALRTLSVISLILVMISCVMVNASVWKRVGEVNHHLLMLVGQHTLSIWKSDRHCLLIPHSHAC